MSVQALDLTDCARFLAHYAKDYHAGAFATPTVKELAKSPEGTVREWGGPNPGQRTVAVVRVLSRNSVRTDFTGRAYGLAAGSVVVTHIARAPGSPVPDLGFADYVYAYREDQELAEGLFAQHRAPMAVRVSAAAEVIACWGQGVEAFRYPEYDAASVTMLPEPFPEPLRSVAVQEVENVSTWADDYPYYSDGTWGAISLRGYWPAEPTRGIKPLEMPKSWQNEHPADLPRRPEWTTAADAAPAIVEWVRTMPWWHDFERVRLLRMAGNDGKGGALARHSDVTDKDAGLRDGQIARFHVPIITDPAIQLHAWDLDGRQIDRHLAQWRLYYLDARKPHSVTNPTGVDRVHLVVDVVATKAVRDAVGDAHAAGG